MCLLRDAVRADLQFDEPAGGGTAESTLQKLFNMDVEEDLQLALQIIGQEQRAVLRAMAASAPPCTSSKRWQAAGS